MNEKAESRDDHFRRMVLTYPDKPMYEYLAQWIDAYHRSVERGATDWVENHRATIEAAIDATAPYDLKFDFDESNGEKLLMWMEYHHMNEQGMWDGWESYSIRVKGSLQFGTDIYIGGRDRHDVKEMLYDTIGMWLNTPVTYGQWAFWSGAKDKVYSKEDFA